MDRKEIQAEIEEIIKKVIEDYDSEWDSHEAERDGIFRAACEILELLL